LATFALVRFTVAILATCLTALARGTAPTAAIYVRFIVIFDTITASRTDVCIACPEFVGTAILGSVTPFGDTFAAIALACDAVFIDFALFVNGTFVVIAKVDVGAVTTAVDVCFIGLAVIANINIAVLADVSVDADFVTIIEDIDTIVCQHVITRVIARVSQLRRTIGIVITTACR
jgi:hypothetical protein